jgi:hypothetical protein
VVKSNRPEQNTDDTSSTLLLLLSRQDFQKGVAHTLLIVAEDGITICDIMDGVGNIARSITIQDDMDGWDTWLERLHCEENGVWYLG